MLRRFVPALSRHRRSGAATAAFGLVVGVVAASGAARAEDDVSPYRPLRAETGAAVVPSPDLAETVERLRAAAAAKDVDAVGALFAARLTFVVSGITLDVPRSVERRPARTSAKDVLADVASLHEEGDLPARGAPVPPRPSATEVALRVILDDLEEADWGRDPLVPGAVCTYRGARWSAREARVRGSGEAGFWVTAPTEVRAAAEDAETVARLVPGRIYFQGYLDTPTEGWRGIRLPAGGVGAVPDAKLHPTRVGGLCFSAKTGGGWIVSTFTASRL
ncbi:MAG: hypothetical protein GX458_22620 [Phyllobacteriaceae bacterium]|nr:hypothetical protein [Phyllobacteriaceae bacterium]